MGAYLLMEALALENFQGYTILEKSEEKVVAKKDGIIKTILVEEEMTDKLVALNPGFYAEAYHSFGDDIERWTFRFLRNEVNFSFAIYHANVNYLLTDVGGNWTNYYLSTVRKLINDIISVFSEEPKNRLRILTGDMEIHLSEKLKERIK